MPEGEPPFEDFERIINAGEEECVKDSEAYERGEYERLTDVVIPKPVPGMDIGLAYLMLGDCERGREWLATTTSLWKFKNTVDSKLENEAQLNKTSWTKVLNPLCSAILSRSETVLSNTVSEAKAVIDDIPDESRAERGQGHEQMCNALMAVAINDRDRSAVVSRFRTVAERRSANHGEQLYLPIATALTGILEADIEKVTAELEDRLQFHNERAVEPPRPQREIEWRMDRLAATVGELAHRQGLTLQIESEYLPPCVFSD